jgi:hypothetical protein
MNLELVFLFDISQTKVNRKYTGNIKGRAKVEDTLEKSNRGQMPKRSELVHPVDRQTHLI